MFYYVFISGSIILIVTFFIALIIDYAINGNCFRSFSLFPLFIMLCITSMFVAAVFMIFWKFFGTGNGRRSLTTFKETISSLSPSSGYYDPCTDYSNYVWKMIPYKRSTKVQMETIESNFIDSMEDITNLRGRNSKMVEFYNMCVNSHDDDTGVRFFREDMKICGGKSIMYFSKHIEASKTLDSLQNVYLMIENCENKYLPFVTYYMDEFFTENVFTYFTWNKNLQVDDKNDYKMFIRFNELFPNTFLGKYTILDIQKYNNMKGELVRRASDGFDNFKCQEGGLVCFDVDYEKYSPNPKSVFTLNQWKLYMMMSMFETVYRFNMDSSLDCAATTKLKFPISYCEGVHSEFFAFGEYQKQFLKMKNNILDFLVMEFFENPSHYGLHLCLFDRDGLKQFLTEKIKYVFGGCVITNSDAKYYYFEKNVGKFNSFAEAYFNKNSRVLRDDLPTTHYDHSLDIIYFPFSKLIPPVFSINFPNSSKLGVFGIPLLHEVFHAVIKYVERSGDELCRYRIEEYFDFDNHNDEEKLCDNLALTTISRMVMVNSTSGIENRDIFEKFYHYMLNENQWMIKFKNDPRFKRKYTRIFKMFNMNLGGRFPWKKIFSDIYSCQKIN